ncbi:hypothetical protein GF380_02380 [Candidatus Uhrbacteria bacterium]|nr:hypothetical protein [Candidatus Uhrbacteria bacterium]
MLPGLEEQTGADMLISILSIPASSDTLLRKHCESGALVQLKRWGDLQSAITTEQRLFHEVQAMTSWSRMSWLVVSGVIFPVNDRCAIGKIENVKLLRNNIARVTARGRKALAYNSVLGALLAWRIYGGYVEFLPDNDKLLSWCKLVARLLEAIDEGAHTELKPRSALRELREPGPVSWLAAMFKGIGRKTAEAVFLHLKEQTGQPATLYQALAYVTSYRACDIPGITKERVAEWRHLLGLRYIEGTKINPPMYQALALESLRVDTGKPFLPWNDESEFSVAALKPLCGIGAYARVKHTGGEVAGLLMAVQVESVNDWLILEDKDQTREVRLDTITDIVLEDV